jgi:8-oxo-dGTP diphosphatase
MKYPIVAVDVIIFTIEDQELKVILIKMKKKPYKGIWAFPGGRVGLKESLDKAAQRELFEKTGVKRVYLEQLRAFGDVKRDPFDRVVSVAYYALIDGRRIKKLKTTSKYAGIDWFGAGHLPPLAYDHKKMAKLALKELREKLEYTNVVYNLLPKYFTLGELRRVYEVILGKKLDKRNFRRKIFGLNLLKSTGRKKRDVSHRPATLYYFKKRGLMTMEIL